MYYLENKIFVECHRWRLIVYNRVQLCNHIFFNNKTCLLFNLFSTSLMFIEIILVLASINGIGFELVMIETRISMFLLHFLYYVPVIYYLSKDEIFYVNSINKRSYSGRIVILLYYIFNKYKNIYLLTFVALIFVYFALSLKI